MDSCNSLDDCVNEFNKDHGRSKSEDVGDIGGLARTSSLIQWNMQMYDCVDSTNHIIKQALSEGVEEGFCVTALQQKGGYGRQGRAWTSPVGGLYVSLAFRPIRRGASFERIPSLSLAMSQAVFCTLANVVEEPSKLAIKWPNDLLYDDGKIAGISLEAVSGGICVGIGINLFPNKQAGTFPGKYKPSYVFEEQVDKILTSYQRNIVTDMLHRLLGEVSRMYEQWVGEGFASFADSYRDKMAFVGSQVSLEAIDGSLLYEGVIEGIDDMGCLLIRDALGRSIRVNSGEVHIKTLRNV